MEVKKKYKNSLMFFIYTIIALIALLLLPLMPTFVITADAQDFMFFDEQIKAYAVTRFLSGFTEYEVRLTWSDIEGANEYKVFKSINQGEYDEIRADYVDEGFQFWWIDDEIVEGYTYSYYIEGYWQGEPVGTTKVVDVDFWLPSCPASSPIDNEVIEEEEPEFIWESISINAFPFKNVIFSAQGEFLIHNLTEDKEIWRVDIDDINTANITFNQEAAQQSLEIKNQYQWQYKVTGYDANSEAIAESITGGVFSFQEKTEEIEPVVEEEDIEDSLNIDAGFISYQVIEGEDVIIAREKVNLRYQDIILTADYLQIIVDKNELIAKDQVVFTKGEESYSSQALSYNWKTEKIIMEGLSGEATGEKIKGKVYYQGGKLETFPETIEISSGFFTTCDLEKPHWHIEAEQIIIYIDDKIIAKKITWYEGERKIFTLPSFMIFLRGKNQLPYLPDIGQSSSEGWFFKNQINYVEDESSYGSIYLDWMEKKGIGAGIEHTFELGEKRVDDGELVLYMYALKRKNTDIFDVNAKINYWQNFENDLRLRANVAYDGLIYPGSHSQTSKHTVKPDFYLYKKWENSLLTLTGKYNLNISDTMTSTGNVKLVYDQSLFDNLKSNLVLLYTSKDSTNQPIEHQLRPEWQLRYAGSGYTVSLITEKLFNLGNEPGSTAGSTLDKIPELVFNKSSSKFMDTKINYSINTSIGRYYESATDQENVRGEYIINVNRPFDITDNIRLTASGVYRQDVYLTGEARYLVGGKLDLRVSYRPEFYGNFSYNYYMSEGPTPFNFDVLSPLTESASASVVLRPRDDLQINLSTNYNFVIESFGSLGARIQWKPKGEHDINLSTNYDLNKMQWNKRIDTKMSLKLSEEWKISYSGSIFFDDFDIRNSVISVVRDLHCREISINYRQSTQSIWVDFKIKAFPTESITIGG